MACINRIYSVSALVGNGRCNANCDFCAGKYLRRESHDDQIYEKNLEAAIKLSARYGGWSLSLTGSGEPTCDPDAVTRALQVYDRCARQGAYFPNVNLFTNGIFFGQKYFCDEFLPQWKTLGLTNVAVSIHDTDRYGQANAYHIHDYPALDVIADNIRSNGVGVRATLLLRKGGIDTAEKYRHGVESLIVKGFDNITSWPVGKPDGTRDQFTPSRWNLFKIRRWLHKNAKLCHGHAWGGGVYDYDGTILRLTSYVTRHNPKKDFVRQLVVFQDGTVAYSWIRDGALCMK